MSKLKSIGSPKRSFSDSTSYISPCRKLSIYFNLHSVLLKDNPSYSMTAKFTQDPVSFVCFLKKDLLIFLSAIFINLYISYFFPLFPPICPKEISSQPAYNFPLGLFLKLVSCCLFSSLLALSLIWRINYICLKVSISIFLLLSFGVDTIRNWWFVMLYFCYQGLYLFLFLFIYLMNICFKTTVDLSSVIFISMPHLFD